MCGILQRECRALINEINAEAGLRDESKLRWFDWLNWKRLSAQQACCSPQGWQLLWAHSLLAMLLMIILQDVESLNIPLSFVIAMRRTSEISFLNFDASFLDFRADLLSASDVVETNELQDNFSWTSWNACWFENVSDLNKLAKLLSCWQSLPRFEWQKAIFIRKLQSAFEWRVEYPKHLRLDPLASLKSTWQGLNDFKESFLSTCNRQLWIDTRVDVDESNPWHHLESLRFSLSKNLSCWVTI